MDPWNFLFRFPILLSFPKSPQVQNITSSDLDLTLIVQLDRTILNSLEFSAQRRNFGIKKVSRKTD